MPMTVINSTHNEQIKLLRSLSNKKSRQEKGLFLLEGANLIGDAPRGYVQKLYVRLCDAERYAPLAERLGITPEYVADSIFDAVSDTVNSNGILAVAKLPVSAPISSDTLLVLDGISDSGNLGTIIRTAVAMGVTDVICADCADVYAPKVVRATMGGIYYVNVSTFSCACACDALKGYEVAALDMKGQDIYSYAPPKKLALVVGSEAHGVSPMFRERADKILSIPMYGGKIESLNAAVSASIALSVVQSKKR